VVLQAPALCHVAHKLGCPVVMMHRSPCDNRKSEDRVHWRTLYDALNLEVEQEKYRLKYHLFSEEIALLKCFVWDKVQKQQCTGFDLDYQSLRDHPL
jgi:hypothetical protein